MSLSEIYEQDLNNELQNEEFWNDNIIIKKNVTCEDLFYKLYFKCNDIKFWFETTFKDNINEFCKKYKLELYFSSISSHGI